MVVKPDAGPVTDDELLVRLLVNPAELARSFELHDPISPLHDARIFIQNGLSKFGADRANVLNEALETVNRPRLHNGTG